jgi:hypothetical protein
VRKLSREHIRDPGSRRFRISVDRVSLESMPFALTADADAADTADADAAETADADADAADTADADAADRALRGFGEQI